MLTSNNIIIAGDDGIDHNGNDGGDPMRGGRQSQRDQSIKRYPKEFQRWYHKEIKPDVHPGRDATPEELEEGYQDWLDLGRPAVKTVATGLTWGLIGWGTYEGLKWGAAVFLIPETGGGSLGVAGALP
jgi:hypothetical protein